MKKVLVIDDTSEVRDLVVAALGSHGFEMVEAENGAAGVEQARKTLPDLILCDVRMPGMDGYGVLSALRADAATATIPFIFLSGAAHKASMRQGMELGADDYLTKPFAFDELLAAVNSRLKKQEAVAQLTEKKLEDLRGNISLALPHELLTPLHGILGLSSLLIEGHETMKPVEILEFARNIHDSGLRLNRLIENFLLYSRIELVAADPQKVAALRSGATVQIKNVIQEICLRLAHMSQRTPDLFVQLQEATLPVQGEYFKKLVEELLDNALKFSSPGTPVRVTTAVGPEGVTLATTNLGRGLTPEQIARVGAHMQFDRKHYEQQGSGLGLIIAKRLIELHGGRFTIESVPGEHTTVTAVFPLPGA